MKLINTPTGPQYRLDVGDPVLIRGNRMDSDRHVVKVGRDYYTLDGRGERIPIRPREGDRDNGCRHLKYGRAAWLSEQAFNEFTEAAALRARLREVFTGYSCPLTLGQFRRIAAIVDEGRR